MPEGIGVFGPGLPGRWARLTPGGRRQMRAALTEHLQGLRAMPALPPEHLASVERLLRRYGGDPDSIRGPSQET